MKLNIDNLFYLTYVESGLYTVIKNQFLKETSLKIVYLNKIHLLKR